MSAIRVVVVDDEHLARRRIVRLLEDREGFELAGEFDSGWKAAQTRYTTPTKAVVASTTTRVSMRFMRVPPEVTLPAGLSGA